MTRFHNSALVAVALLAGLLSGSGLSAQPGRSASAQGGRSIGKPPVSKQGQKPVAAKGKKPSAATQSKPSRAEEQLQAQIQARIEEMRRAIRKGTPQVSHVHVTVWLRNSHRVKGVVKNGRFIEKVDGLDFVTADKKTPGAGLRVWYYDDTNSYIFFPFKLIARYKIGARLNDVQLREIEDRITTERERSEGLRREILARRNVETGEAGKKAGDEAMEKSGEEAAKKAREEERLLALLEEFPPESGWSEKKMEEIQLRKITVGAFPDEESKRFLEVFDNWKKALALKTTREAGLKEPGAKDPGLPPGVGGKTPPSGETKLPATPPGGAPVPVKRP